MTLVLSTINETIEAIVDGEASLEGAPREVLLECARRYVETQTKLRERAASRSREALAKFEDDKTGAKARLRGRMNLIATEMAHALHQNWTASLLASGFALPDGTRVTWANATAAQHEIRASQLEALAAGDIKTASIHRQAINDLRVAGVNTLAELS